ncbi:hypothetical protein IAD21_04673 [Abditibacteriota bacterium]|nr:hypothetical protein IAD21_04673 [Abditibacteriota bacterium]
MRDTVALVIVASIIVIGMSLALLEYDAHPHIFQGAFGIVVLGVMLRSLRYRAWLRRMGCWLEYIHETPRDEGDFDFAITYRYNEQEVRFYGNKASRERAKMIALPPVENWPQKFPSWVFDKREFILKTLAYHYEVEWSASVLYPVLSQVDGGPVEEQDKLRFDEVGSVSGAPVYSWKIERGDLNDYKGRVLSYEEPGFRLVTYLEMSGVNEFNWLGGDNDFSTWTEPRDVPIDARKHEELLVRLAQWCREHNTRISLAPGISMEEYFWREEREGKTIVHNDDGSVEIR